ncbi:MAG: nuclear transport factor 2 family protein [Thermodesulfobacteriota bacterium]|jgi:ketosteroid isomerase-like protein
MEKDETQAVLAANAAFYRAFETLEVKEMEAVWLRASHIKCIHPGWPLLCGWGPIMASWQRIFANTFSMHFTLTDLRVAVSDALAWVVLTENLESHSYDGPSRAQILTTNVFEKRDGQWFIVHHHASPVLVPSSPPEEQLQ